MAIEANYISELQIHHQKKEEELRSSVINGHIPIIWDWAIQFVIFKCSYDVENLSSQYLLMKENIQDLFHHFLSKSDKFLHDQSSGHLTMAVKRR